MGGSEEVLRGVATRRLITTSDATALLADAQMNPVLTTCGQALLAPRGQHVDGVDAVEMGASPTHGVRAHGTGLGSG
jgi:hypothetical protein